MALHKCETVEAMRAYTREQRRQGRILGLVPTMGSLHSGHLALIAAAKKRCDCVIVSIYVNPSQFSVNEDFSVYPRGLERDLELLKEAGCHAVFLPSLLYHPGTNATNAADASMVVVANEAAGAPSDAHSTWVTVDLLSAGLCADSRPHFFRGVATVVCKMFNIVGPDVAIFGKKDYQQWRVLERMARDLDFGIEVVGMDTVREEDGVALSSRNALLSPERRAAAPAIYKALRSAADAVCGGKQRSTQEIAATVSNSIALAGGSVDYVHVVDAQTMAPLAAFGPRLALIAVAAFFGSVRLIDNIEVPPVET